MNIVLIAPPASGKGTQAKMLKDKYNLYHLSTGDLLRNISKDGSELGIKVKSIIDEGKLIDDDLMIEIVKEKIYSIKSNGIIFDGFPRTLNQAIKLDEMLKEINKKIDNVIVLEIDKEIALKRSIGRVACSNCGNIYNIYFDDLKNPLKCNNCNNELIKRNDDTEEKFNLRFDSYVKNSKKLIEYYEKKNIVNFVSSLNDKETVFAEIKNIINRG